MNVSDGTRGPLSATTSEVPNVPPSTLGPLRSLSSRDVFRMFLVTQEGSTPVVL